MLNMKKSLTAKQLSSSLTQSSLGQPTQAEVQTQRKNKNSSLAYKTYKSQKQQLDDCLSRMNELLVDGQEINKTDFNKAKELVKSTNRVSLNLQDHIPGPGFDSEGIEEDQTTRFELSLAMLTKCKELVELLQQLFTLSMIKHPTEFDHKKNMKQGHSMYAPIYRLKALTLNNIGCTFMKQNKVSEAYEYLR